MFRPQITEEMKNTRENGAIHIVYKKYKQLC